MKAVTTKVLQFNVNGKRYDLDARADETLVKVLREKMGLTGTKVGCESGECGACTVLIDGQPRLSCLIFAIGCEGKRILTIECLSEPETQRLHPIQEAFIENFGAQCAYCNLVLLWLLKPSLTGRLGRHLQRKSLERRLPAISADVVITSA